MNRLNPRGPFGVCFVAACVWLGALLANAAPLRPDELLLLYNAGDRDSQAIAEYYAKAHGVPADRLFGLFLSSKGEEIARDGYEQGIRAPVLKRLEQAGFRDKVRCLVTFYGLPIRVGPQPQRPELARLLEKRRGEFNAALEQFKAAIRELDPAALPFSRPMDKAGPEAEFQRLELQYGKARLEVFQRARARVDASEGQAQLARLMQVIEKVEGVAGVLAQVNVSAPGPVDNPVVKQFEAAGEKLQADQQRINEAMARDLGDPARDAVRELLRQDFGINGLLLNLQSEITSLRVDETTAAVDSELALVWWGNYPKYRWVPNPLNWRYRAQQVARNHMEGRPPALMVSRIDGPTPAIARGLIDKALAVEKAGPTGKVYLDARGISEQKEGYGPYDETLRRLAKILQTRTTLPVKLDNREKLFGPGECPDTMLYCGWYSLRKYVDAFTFAPGAVGYHLASFEAASLKRPDEQGWCKRMLDNGITATLGPVAEPYLQSFPPPDDFFGLLLTGRFTLAEVFAYTSPFDSWMQMLIGDPLYRPFAHAPALRLEDAVPMEIIPAEYRPGSRPVTKPG